MDSFSYFFIAVVKLTERLGILDFPRLLFGFHDARDQNRKNQGEGNWLIDTTTSCLTPIHSECVCMLLSLLFIKFG